MSNLIHNPLFNTDSYKWSHIQMAIPGTTRIYSHLTPRNNKYLKKAHPELPNTLLVFGVQYAVRQLVETWDKHFFSIPWEQVSEELLEVLNPHIGISQGHTVDLIKALHTLGYLPLHIKAIEEGTVLPLGIPVLTITNTADNFYWLPNFLESTILNNVFKPLTAATICRGIYKLRLDSFNKTSDNLGGLDFAIHDFSFRGHHGTEAARQASMAQLLFSKGTDTLVGLTGIKHYYDAKETAYSINATEHSVTTQGILFYANFAKNFRDLAYAAPEVLSDYYLRIHQDSGLSLNVIETAHKCLQKYSGEYNELAYGELVNLVRLLLEVYPTGILAYVSDSFDYYRLISKILPAIKDVITSRDGKLVVRPDSSDPVTVINGKLKKSVTVPEWVTTEEDLKCYAEDFLLEKLEDSTPHGIDGGDREEDTFLWKDGKYHIQTLGIVFNRHDKQYYYLDRSLCELKTSIYKIDITPEDLGTAQVLWNIFGGTVNSKGYKVLDSHIGMVYGDGMTYDRIKRMDEGLESSGYSAENICTALGAYTLGNITRDDLGFAIKASNTTIALDYQQPVYKDPMTDRSKSSPKGFLQVLEEDGTYVLKSDVTPEEECLGALQTIFLNGAYDNQVVFDDLRLKVCKEV